MATNLIKPEIRPRVSTKPKKESKNNKIDIEELISKISKLNIFWLGKNFAIKFTVKFTIKFT